MTIALSGRCAKGPENRFILAETAETGAESAETDFKK